MYKYAKFFEKVICWAFFMKQNQRFGQFGTVGQVMIFLYLFLTIDTLNALSTNSTSPLFFKMYLLLDPLFLELIVKYMSSEPAQPVRETQAVLSFSR